MVSVPVYVPAGSGDGLSLTSTPIEAGVAPLLVPTPSHGPPDLVVAATVKLIGAPALEIVRTWLAAPEPPTVVAKYSDVELTERPVEMPRHLTGGGALSQISPTIHYRRPVSPPIAC